MNTRKKKFLDRFGPQGRSLLDIGAHNEVAEAVDALLNCKIVFGNVVNPEVHVTQSNVVFVLPASLAQGKSVDVAYMKVKEIGQEAYRCNKIESGITGTDNFYVERPSLMKTTLLNRTIDAVNITYVYDASYVARSASDGVASEAQILIDRLNINDVLLCVKIPDKSLAFLTGGDPVNATYADMNVDGRYWARRDVD